MTPDYRAALYTLIENAITASGPSDALFQASVPRTSRGQVSQQAAEKTVRIASGPGRFNFGAEASIEAVDCLFTIQCWVTPRSDSDADLEDALDKAMLMANELNDAIHNDHSFGGAVCSSTADEYDAEFANHGGMLKAVVYLDGVINPVGAQG